MNIKDIQKMGELYKQVISGATAEELDEAACNRKKMSEAELDPVDKKAVKKDFDDRKDKDIDNDGDADSSDEYLHKKRKAISKNMKEFVDTLEGVSIEEGLAGKDAVLTKDKRKEKGFGDWKKGTKVKVKEFLGSGMFTVEFPDKSTMRVGQSALAVSTKEDTEVSEAKQPGNSGTAPEEMDSKDSPKAKKFKKDSEGNKEVLDGEAIEKEQPKEYKMKKMKEFFDMLDTLSLEEMNKMKMKKEEMCDKCGKEPCECDEGKKEDPKDSDDVSSMIKKNSEKRADAEDGTKTEMKMKKK